MKRTLSILLTFVLVSSVIFSGNFSVFAEDVIGDYTYLISGSTCKILSYSGTDDIVDIPGTISSYIVTGIGDNAFTDCVNIKKLTIPNSVLEISTDAFSGCTGLTEFVVAETNLYFSSEDGVLLNKSKTWLLAYPIAKTGNYSIGERVTVIGERAFLGAANLTEITIPYGVSGLCNYTFCNCPELRSVTILNRRTSIPEYAFTGCSKLEKAYFLCDVPLSYLMDTQAFKNCDPSFKIFYKSGSEGWTNPFRFCSTASCETLTVDFDTQGGRLITDPEYAIYNKLIAEPFKPYRPGFVFEGWCLDPDCTSPWDFSSMRITGDITLYAKWSIAPAPTQISTPEGAVFTNQGKTLVSVPKDITEYAIPNGVTIIESSAFANCKRLTRVSMPDSVTAMGDFAFQNCSVLEEINLSKNIKEIGLNTFEGCTLLKRMEIPYGVTVIKEYAFRSCSSLDSISIPITVTTIYEYSFLGCKRLTLFSDSKDVRSFTNYSAMSLKPYALFYATSKTVSLIPEAFSFKHPDWQGVGHYLGYVNTGNQVINFDVIPYASDIDSQIAYIDSSTLLSGTGFDDLAIQVRMNLTGSFDVRNGTAFACENTVNYSPNTKYHVEIQANMNAHTYSVWITLPGGVKTQIANNYVFRSTAPVTDDIGKVFFISETANNLFKVENHTISSADISTATPTPTATPSPTATPTPTTTPTPLIAVTQIRLSSSATIKVGKTLKLSAVVSPSTASNKSVKWSTSNSKIAVVSSTGLVTAKARGTVSITVTTIDGGKKATCRITVIQPVKSVTLSRTSLTLKKGKTYILKATVGPSNANNKQVTWKSGKRNVAIVSSSGRITAKEKGTTYIYVTTTDGKKTAKCKVVVI